ncbi:hypothetical protein [Archangium sp.]|uniref:hypothetical protein n=1 Tax=Archangium sp. TaxID=1872627 RepID=UPI00286BC730|nr:hypothetical protein [Archangium sp.]
MGRSRIPLVALVGAVGCTSQEATPPSEASQAATSPWRKLKDALTPSESRSKGGGLRALTPEERASLLPQPLPRPEGLEAQPAPVATVEVQDGGTAPTDYAEQRRQQYEQRMLQLEEDALRRDAGTERTPEELAEDQALANELGPLDIADQRRQQLARERLGSEEFRKFGKGGSMKRRKMLHIIIRGSADGGG